MTSFPLISTRLESRSISHSGEHDGADFSKLAGLRVLVVDDETDTRQLISHSITRRGAEVKTCGSAREALELLEQWRPDVLLSDIGMPDEDGYTLISKVRALPPERVDIRPQPPLLLTPVKKIVNARSPQVTKCILPSRLARMIWYRSSPSLPDWF